MHQGDLCAESMKDSGKLKRDITATNDERAVREFLEKERLVRSDGQFGARCRRDRRPTAGGGEDIFGGDAFAVNRYGMRIANLGPSPDNLGAGIDQEPFVDAVKPSYLIIL